MTYYPVFNSNISMQQNRKNRKSHGTMRKFSEGARERRYKASVKLGLLILIIALSFSFGFMVNVYAFSGEVVSGIEEETQYRIIEVKIGDTLWSIASKQLPDGMDIREYIFSIKKVNGLRSSLLYEGQYLKLPN